MSAQRETGATSGADEPRGPVLLKLGGALITRKEGREAPRKDVLARLADEIAGWPPAGRGGLLIAHGSGSFAHVAARETRFLERPDDPFAFARVADAAARLNRLVVTALLEAGLPAVGMPGGLLARCEAGRVAEIRAAAPAQALDAGLLPVTYGDVALDARRGGAIASTEPLLAALARALDARRLVLATDVDGVYPADPHSAPGRRPLPRLTADEATRLDIGGARRGVTDVTGGMAGKLRSLFELLSERPTLEVRIVSGLRAGAVAAALAGEEKAGGTRILAG